MAKPLFEWKPEHSVHVERFDREHQTLFRLLNELNDSMADGRGKFEVARTLRALSDYCRQHFAGEEEAMRKAGYPDLEAHAYEHSLLTARVQKYSEEYLTSPTAVPIDVLFFLRDWLLHHILETDRRYAEAMNAAGIR
jgi:hemerythrin-like metal-binding protein